jgi:hypothetical protein
MKLWRKLEFAGTSILDRILMLSNVRVKGRMLELVNVGTCTTFTEDVMPSFVSFKTLGV